MGESVNKKTTLFITAFLIFAVLCTGGFFASLARGRIREKSMANRTGREKRTAEARSREEERRKMRYEVVREESNQVGKI